MNMTHKVEELDLSGFGYKDQLVVGFGIFFY